MKPEKHSPDVPINPTVLLTAGSLSMDFDAGDLRSIRWGSMEVVRRIYFAVRDQQWSTAECTILDSKETIGKEGFLISYRAKYAYANETVYESEVTLTGKGNEVTFHVKATAVTDFLRNRVGICLHQPIQGCVGQTATVTRPDAAQSVYQSPFPELIAPHQPFLEMQQMKWSADGQFDVAVDFEGDIFETEDQRNWGDACYKTYSTPLRMGFPVQIRTGDTVEQKVTIKIKQAAAATASKGVGTGAVSNKFPRVGYGKSSAQGKLTPAQLSALKKVPFEAYRCELRLADTQWQQLLAECASEAMELHTRLDLVVFFGAGQKSSSLDLAAALSPYATIIHSVLVLEEGKKVTPESLINELYPQLKAALPKTKVGYGTDGYFTELNRSRPAASTLFDFVSFSLNPQVHASDARSIMENVEALPWVIKTARSLALGREVYVSPLTLKRRRNHDATAPQPPVPETPDERQNTAFLAGFTVLALAALSGADRVILFETVGPRGLMGDQPFPVYELLRKIREFNPGSISVAGEINWESVVTLNNADGELRL